MDSGIVTLLSENGQNQRVPNCILLLLFDKQDQAE